jgi:hypothetical protein
VRTAHFYRSVWSLTPANAALILGKIMHDIYAIKPSQGRHTAAVRLEEDLDKWYLDLPESIRYDVAAPSNNVPPPHILTLHMQYWTAVLLLHRPLYVSFHRSLVTLVSPICSTRHLPRCLQSGEDTEICSTAKKEFDACVRAANHITSIGAHFPIWRCSAPH